LTSASTSQQEYIVFSLAPSGRYWRSSGRQFR
jgi:hypothetical protein